MKITFNNQVVKLGAVASTYLMTTGAHAQTENVVTMSQTASENIYATTQVLSVLSYVIGGFFGLVGVMALKQHVDSPSQHPMGKGIGRIAVGALLCALPFVLNTAFNSVGVNETAGVGVDGSTDRF